MHPCILNWNIAIVAVLIQSDFTNMAVMLSDLLRNLTFNRSAHCTQVSDQCPLGLLFMSTIDWNPLPLINTYPPMHITTTHQISRLYSHEQWKRNIQMYNNTLRIYRIYFHRGFLLILWIQIVFISFNVKCPNVYTHAHFSTVVKWALSESIFAGLAWLQWQR